MEILRFLKKTESLYTVQELDNKYTRDLYFEFYNCQINLYDCIYLDSKLLNEKSKSFVQPLCFELGHQINPNDITSFVNTDSAVLFVNNTQEYFILKRIYG